MAILPLNEILEIMLRHCREKYAEYVSVLFNHKVVDVGQDSTHAWAFVEEIGGEGEAKTTAKIEADYLVGCDGGQSTIRKKLFGHNWPGDTFACRLLVQNVRCIDLDQLASLTYRCSKQGFLRTGIPS